MSNIQYGLISRTDADTLEKTIDLICDEFKGEAVEFTEIGIYSGKTGDGINKYFIIKQVASWWNGIDNWKDRQKIIYEPDRFIVGNSNEVYSKLKDNSQHLIFIDGDHSFIGVISDFYAYMHKVKIGGYFAFHDTGVHIKPFKDYQHGDLNNPDAYISVRKALYALGLFDDDCERWELIFDEADETDEAGGITVFKRLC